MIFFPFGVQMGFLFLLIKNFCDFANLRFPLARISLHILPLELKFLVSYLFRVEAAWDFKILGS